MALGSKSSALATPSYLSQSRPKLKVWTPTRLNLIAVGPGVRENTAEFLLQCLPSCLNDLLMLSCFSTYHLALMT